MTGFACKSQKSTSGNTTEAELASMNRGLKRLALPALDFWEAVGRVLPLLLLTPVGVSALCTPGGGLPNLLIAMLTPVGVSAFHTPGGGL